MENKKSIKRNENNDAKYFNSMNQNSDQNTDDKNKMHNSTEDEELQYFTE